MRECKKERNREKKRPTSAWVVGLIKPRGLLVKDEESASLELRVSLSAHTKASGAQELMFPDTRPLISCPNPLPHVHQQPPGSHVELHKGSPWCTECHTLKFMWSSRASQKCRCSIQKLRSPAVYSNASQHSLSFLYNLCRSISHILSIRGACIRIQERIQGILEARQETLKQVITMDMGQNQSDRNEIEI